ncbi:MAG: hypothetical protein ACXQS2_04570 [Methermicoccaceae archaeon]
MVDEGLEELRVRDIIPHEGKEWVRHIKRALHGEKYSGELMEVFLMKEFGWTPSQIDEMDERDYVRVSRVMELIQKEGRHVHR